MNPERAKKLLPVIAAFADGKVIQVKLFDRIVEHPWEDYTGGNANFFNDQWEWRIKPEPNLRPFTMAEACLFRLFRTLRDNKTVFVPIKFMAGSIYFHSSLEWDYAMLTAPHFECSIDGVTWQKCGVEVTTPPLPA